MSAYLQHIGAIVDGRDIGREASSALMSDMLEGAIEQTQLAALLTAWAAKGETASELAGLAAIMRQHMITIDAPQDTVDTCGTGGSGFDTINTSTLCAFVLAAAGVPVAKHGNRASSGRCGSMDVLEAMGVAIEILPKQAQRLLAEQGVVFMYARRHHPSLGHVTPVRRILGFRTTFNFLGPICNPAMVRRQMLGVSDPDRAPLLLQSLAELGSERAMVVWGEDGLDELSLASHSRVWMLEDGEIDELRVCPEDVGLTRVSTDKIKGGDVHENLKIAETVLRGTATRPYRDHVAYNAGAGLLVAGVAESLSDGVEQAVAILDDGEAWDVFERYRDATLRLS
ncbi:MAG: anthranilate phosphoribosyltransferase [Flavobacteriales bacterium]|jgi:anthranilate phosphoribosyltransferase